MIIGDKVVLKSYEALHASESRVCLSNVFISKHFHSLSQSSLSDPLTPLLALLQLMDHSDCMEVNVAVCPDSWRINLFQEYRPDASSFLKVPL